MLDKIYSEKTINELERLKKAPHSVIFSGKVGSEGLKAAAVLSAEWLGTEYLMIHPDYCLIDSEKNILTKDDVAVVGENSYASPALGPFRVYVIKDAYRLNGYAQNSLLKALEDNEPRCKIIFVNGNGLLETIRSRCYCMEFNSIPFSGFLGGGADLLAYTAADGVCDEYLAILSNDELYDTFLHIPDCFTGKTAPLKLFGMEKEKSPGSFFEKAGHREKMWLLNLLKAGFGRVITKSPEEAEEVFRGYYSLKKERAEELLFETAKFQKNIDSKTAADFFTFIIKLGKEIV